MIQEAWEIFSKEALHHIYIYIYTVCCCFILSLDTMENIHPEWSENQSLLIEENIRGHASNHDLFSGIGSVALQSCEVPHRYSRFPFPASQIALALWSIKVLREYYSIFFAALFIGLRKRFSPYLAPHATIGVIIPTSFYYWGDNPYLASSSNQSKPVVIIQISRF